MKPCFHNRRMSHPQLQLQRVGCPDTEDNNHVCHQKTGNDHIQEDMDETASLKRREPSMICSFRKFALLIEVPRGITADRDTAVRTVLLTRRIFQRDERALWRSPFHMVPKQKSEEWMHLSLNSTCMHGEWLWEWYAKFTSQYSLPFSLKVRGDWGS